MASEDVEVVNYRDFDPSKLCIRENKDDSNSEFFLLEYNNASVIFEGPAFGQIITDPTLFMTEKTINFNEHSFFYQDSIREEHINVIVEQTNVSYETAKKAYEIYNCDVVNAIMSLTI
jgi:NACalpha-BTF3-like transcription factor